MEHQGLMTRKLLVGARGFEPRTPCAQGSVIGSRRSIDFREFLMVTTIRGSCFRSTASSSEGTDGVRTQFWHSEEAGAQACDSINSTGKRAMPFRLPAIPNPVGGLDSRGGPRHATSCSHSRLNRPGATTPSPRRPAIAPALFLDCIH